MACMILGIIFFGILLGSIAEALQHMSKESERVARYRARMEVVDKWMAKRRLPVKLRSRIGHYYAEARLPSNRAHLCGEFLCRERHANSCRASGTTTLRRGWPPPRPARVRGGAFVRETACGHLPLCT